MSKRKRSRPSREEGSRPGGTAASPDPARPPSTGAVASPVPVAAPAPGWRFLLALACAAAAFLVFLPTLGFEFVDWDDPGLLTRNPSWRGLGAEQLRWMFTTNHWGHYQPVTWLTYGLDYVVWGMNPRGYHLTNVLFHAANAFLVWFLASFLLRAALPDVARARPRLVDAGALGAALLFAVHPLRVESVAWATERRDLVSAFFILLTLLAYLRSTVAGERRTAWMAATLVIYVVSMLSKVGGAPLPLVFLVLEWYPLGRLRGMLGRRLDRTQRSVLLWLVPFLVVAVGFSIATIKQQAGRWLIPVAVHGYPARTAQAFYGLVFYVWKTVIPVGLSPLYELRFPLDPFASRFVLSAVLVVLVAAVVLWLGRRLPGLLAASLAYVLMIGPLLGYFQNGPQVVADRYSYLSTLGFLIAAAGYAVRLADRRPGPAVRAGLVAAAVALIAVNAVLTLRLSRVWKDTATLWAAMLAHDPESSFANNSYGFVLLERGEVTTAEAHFRKALAINARNREAQYNLAQALRRRGVDEIEADQEALAFNPAEAEIAYRLGNALLKAKRNQEAVEAYLKVLQVTPGDARAHTNLAIVLARLERLEEARQHYQTAVQLDSSLWNARDGLAHVLVRLGRRDEAVATLEQLLRENPGYEPARRRLDGLRQEAGTGAAGSSTP